MSLIALIFKNKPINFWGFIWVQNIYGLSKKLTLQMYTRLSTQDVLSMPFFENNVFLYKLFLEKKRFYFEMLKDIKHVKGRRLIFLLPLNGQRTHTNSKTIKRLFKLKRI